MSGSTYRLLVTTVDADNGSGTVRLIRMAPGGRFRDWEPPDWSERSAGRRWGFTPSGRDEVEAELYQHVQAESAVRRNLSRERSNLPTASQALHQLLRDEVAPQLRRIGFKGSGDRFRLDRGEFQGWLELQKSVHNDKSICEFTFNLGATNRAVAQSYWHDRIGSVLPPTIGMGDTWWVLPRDASTDDLTDDLLRALLNHAAVALDAALDDPQFPSAPTKRWARTFTDPRLRNPARHPRDRDDRVGRLGDSTYDELLDKSTHVNFADLDWEYRWSLLSLMLDKAPDGDTRCLPALAGYLAHEPISNLRVLAAGALACLDVEPEMVLPHLLAANNEDCDPTVRTYARYAHRLVEPSSDAY